MMRPEVPITERYEVALLVGEMRQIHKENEHCKLPEEEQSIVDDEIKWAWTKVLGDAKDDEEFRSCVKMLLNSQLSQEHQKILAECVENPPKWGRGQPAKIGRSLDIWVKNFTFVGRILRGDPNGTPLPTQDEAVKAICKKYSIAKDTAERIYRDVKVNGPKISRGNELLRELP